MPSTRHAVLGIALLLALDLSPGLTAAQLAEALDLDPEEVHGVLVALKDAELLTAA